MVATSVSDEDKEETVKSVPPGANQAAEMSVHPGPVEMTAPTMVKTSAPYSPLQRVEMVVTLQSCNPGNQVVKQVRDQLRFLCVYVREPYHVHRSDYDGGGIHGLHADPASKQERYISFSPKSLLVFLRNFLL